MGLLKEVFDEGEPEFGLDVNSHEASDDDGSWVRRMSHRLMSRKMNKRNCNYLGMSTMVLAMQVLRVF